MEKDKDKEKKEKKYNPEITPEDKQALPKKEMSMDSGEDQLLEEREEKIDFTGKGLDIPGRNQENEAESPALRDEENTHYAQGSDRREHLEERKDSEISGTQK